MRSRRCIVLRSVGLAVLVVGCAGPASRDRGEPPVVELKVERFDPARHLEAAAPGRYLTADEHPGLWLQAARGPDRASFAVAREEAVELYAWPGLTPIWRAAVSPDAPSRQQPAAPLLAFTPDGTRLAWLGGAGWGQRFIVLDVATGAALTDLVFPSLPSPPGSGGGVTPPPTPDALQSTPDGRRFRIDNSFGAYELDPDALRLVALDHRSEVSLRPTLAQDTGAAWDERNAVLTRRGGGGRIAIDCMTHERDIALDEGLDRIAYLCARGDADDIPEIRVRRLSSGERLGAFKFAARWGRLVVLDADTVLALAEPQPRFSALYSLAGAPVRRRDPATDAWVATP